MLSPEELNEEENFMLPWGLRVDAKRIWPNIGLLVSEKSGEALIIDTICPYLEERATRVKMLKIRHIDNPRIVNAILQAFRQN